jgi:hypothetical protein
MVTDADREAALALVRHIIVALSTRDTPDKQDVDVIVEAFKQHRLAERGRIVAWLRHMRRDDTNWPLFLANKIANGEAR